MRPKKICALGDIHIFNSKRFEEHREVFRNLYRILDEEQPELIVITGDVIDSKQRLSPEQFLLARNFFIKLSNYAPILMIMGNHDTALQNKDRMDSLTPIVETLNKDIINPVEYIKHSGIYERFGNKWAVWSCLDDQKNPFPENYVKDDYIIGLYHGVVAGARNEDGYALSGGIDISEFDNCDMVIMSDIHHQQSFRNGEINYTGSMIQVKVNESPEGTCLIYDLDGDAYGRPRVVEILNPYSTVEFDVNNIVPMVVPTQKLRLKYNVDEYTRTQAMEKVKEIRSSTGVRVDLSPIITKKAVNQKVKIDVKSQISSLNAIDYMGDFVTKYAEKLDLVDIDEDMKTLIKLDTEFSKGEIKDFEPGDFFVNKLVLNNILSFGPTDNVVDLDVDGLTGIVGKNRVGKTSILKIIQYLLFDETPGNTAVVKMINKHNKGIPAVATAFFSKSGKTYRIVKKIVPDKTKTKASVSVTFHEVDEHGNEVDNLTKESPVHTKADIRKMLGINEFFEMLSMFSAQKRQTEFIDCKNADRLKLVNKFLGLQNFELKEANVLATIKEKNAVFNNIQKQFDRETDITVLSKNLKRVEMLLKIANSEDKNIKDELAELEMTHKDVITMYNSNKQLAEKNIPDPIKTKQRIEGWEGVISNTNIAINKAKDDIEFMLSAAKFKADVFKEKFGLDVENWVADYKPINEKKQRIAVIDHELARLSKQSNMSTCNGCGRDFTDADRERVQSSLTVLEGEKQLIYKEIYSLEKVLDEGKAATTEIMNLLERVENIETKQMIRYDNSIKDAMINISKEQLQISEYNKVQEAKKVVEMLQDRINSYQVAKDDLQNKSRTNQMQIGTYMTSIKETNDKIKIYQDKIKQLEELEEELRVLKIYRKVVNKDGLPLFILNNKIDEINDRVNTIISQVFDFNLEFSVDEDKGELRIQFSYDGDPDKGDVALASGSETFIINLCIKVALAQISALPKIDTVFIDEGYDSLDKDTIEKIPAMFGVLTNYYKNVITISHLDEIKDMCLNHITLERNGKYTEIV